MEAPAYVNVFVCILSVFCLGLTFFKLKSHYSDPERSEYRFIYYSVFAWTLGWIIWVVLWLLEPRISSEGILRSLLPMFADLNGVFGIITFIGLMRGRELRLTEYLLIGLSLLVGVLGIDAILLFALGGSLGKLSLERWSLVFSMFTPPLVGWAFRARWGTNWIFILGIIYALVQPVAYEAVLHPSVASGYGAEVKWTLAVLKLVLTSLALTFFLKEPADSRSLISFLPNIAKDERGKWWSRLPMIYPIIGTVGILLIVIYTKPVIGNSMLRLVSQIFLTLLLTKGIEWFWRKFVKK